MGEPFTKAPSLCKHTVKCVTLIVVLVKDIDECADFQTNGNSPCDPLAKCENLPGNFTCVCPNGYQGDVISYRSFSD